MRRLQLGRESANSGRCWAGEFVRIRSSLVNSGVIANNFEQFQPSLSLARRLRQTPVTIFFCRIPVDSLAGEHFNRRRPEKRKRRSKLCNISGSHSAVQIRAVVLGPERETAPRSRLATGASRFHCGIRRASAAAWSATGGRCWAFNSSLLATGWERAAGILGQSLSGPRIEM